MVLIHQTLALCTVVKLLRFMQCCKAIMVCFSIKIKKIFVFGNLTQNVGSCMGIIKKRSLFFGRTIIITFVIFLIRDMGRVHQLLRLPSVFLRNGV